MRPRRRAASAFPKRSAAVYGSAVPAWSEPRTPVQGRLEGAIAAAGSDTPQPLPCAWCSTADRSASVEPSLTRAPTAAMQAVGRLQPICVCHQLQLVEPGAEYIIIFYFPSAGFSRARSCDGSGNRPGGSRLKKSRKRINPNWGCPQLQPVANSGRLKSGQRASYEPGADGPRRATPERCSVDL